MLGFSITIGLALLVIGFTAQYLIKRRVQHKKLKQAYMWIAWVTAVLGGTAISVNWGSLTGMTSTGAAVVSILGLLVLTADLMDKRPDWPAFLLAAFLPSIMRLAGGAAGQLFDTLLLLPSQLTYTVGGWLGLG